MSYSRSVYIKAKATLDGRRQRAESERELRRSQVLLKVPEIAELEREMAACSTFVIKMVARGESGEDKLREMSKRNLEIQKRRKAALKESGYPEDYLDIHYSCPNCRDTGYHEGYMCPCYEKLIKETAKKELGVPGLLESSTFENFDLSLYPDVYSQQFGTNIRQQMESILDYCKSWANDFSRRSSGILMFGKTGLGKTHLSLAIALTVIDRGYGVYYNSVQNIMSVLEKQQFGKTRDEDEEFDDKLYKSDLLILDDLGAEFSTQFTVSRLYNILNTRMNNSLPTIVSTNLSMEEIEEKYTNRIASRIIGAGVPLQFVGKDIRQIRSNY